MEGATVWMNNEGHTSMEVNLAVRHNQDTPVGHNHDTADVHYHGTAADFGVDEAVHPSITLEEGTQDRLHSSDEEVNLL